MTAEMTPEQNRDPYAPPPRHKQKSGTIVRVVILGALLAAAAWGYLEFAEGPSLTAEAPAEQVIADTGYDAPVQAVPSTDLPANPEADATPSEEPAG